MCYSGRPNIMMKKSFGSRGQSWTIEFILAFLIFSSAIILSIKMISNIYKSTDFEDLARESEMLSNTFLSDGYPVNWTSADVIRPGIVSDGKINVSKLANLTEIDYYTAKQLLGIRQDFFIYFSDDSGMKDIFEDFGMSGECGYGHPGILIEYDGTCRLNITVDYDDMVKLSRFTVYDHNIITMTVYVWD